MIGHPLITDLIKGLGDMSLIPRAKWVAGWTVWALEPWGAGTAMEAFLGMLKLGLNLRG